MPGNEVVASRDGAILVLTLNRPHRLNAVNKPLYDGLVQALEGARTDGDVRCVVLTGAGRAFSAGADLKEHRDQDPTPQQRRAYAAIAQRANHLVQTIGAPVVAAVNGHAIGAGLELALSADLAIVATDAKLRLPEVALGTFVGGGAVYTLSDRVGVAKAREIIYLGDFFSGADAAAWGVLNRAAPAADVLPEAMRLARRLARRAPIPLAAVKRLSAPMATMTREEALEREQRVLEEIFATDDWREGLAAFHEKRRPEYKGR